MTGVAPLPHAAPATRKALLEWLEIFSGHVRAVDYAAAAPMFHPDILAFGTHRDVIPGLAEWIRTQWDNVWPKTTDFHFDLAGTYVLNATDERMATVISPWTSTGYHADGSRFDRPGRATMVFCRADDDWLCVHSHMSLNRDIPQQSHASRPVKRWPEAMLSNPPDVTA